MLSQYRDEHLGALAATVVRLAGLRLKRALTARQKNAQTIVDKLRLAPKMELSNMQDIAGARVIVAGGRRAQDEVVQEVRSFTSAHVDDAVALRARLEQEHRGDADFEVVLLASRSEAELRQTHARYFKNLGQLVRPGDDDNGQDGEA